MDSIPKIFHWSTSRSLSTAFEWSIRTLKNGKVFHNPFAKARYCGPDKTVSEFAEFGVSTEDLFGPLQPKSSYKDIMAEISPLYEKDYAFIFANVTPHFIEGRFEEIIFHAGFKDFVHTFLIRNPHKMVPSLYRVLVDMFGRNYLSVNRCEYQQMFQLHELIVKRLNTQPVIIDADDLLQEPEGIMRLYCEKTNLPYDENMTKWEPGVLPDWEHCHAILHTTIFESSGFIRKEKGDEKCPISDLYYENDLVRRVIDESIPYYSALYERRLGH